HTGRAGSTSAWTPAGANRHWTTPRSAGRVARGRRCANTATAVSTSTSPGSATRQTAYEARCSAPVHSGSPRYATRTTRTACSARRPADPDLRDRTVGGHVFRSLAVTAAGRRRRRVAAGQRTTVSPLDTLAGRQN